MLDLLALPTVTYLAPSSHHTVIDDVTRPLPPVVYVAVPVAAPVVVPEPVTVPEVVAEPAPIVVPVPVAPAAGRHRAPVAAPNLPPLMTVGAWAAVAVALAAAVALVVVFLLPLTLQVPACLGSTCAAADGGGR